eukprot:32556_1
MRVELFTIIQILSSFLTAADLQSSLVAHFTGYDFDSSGNGNDAQNFGAIVTKDRNGECCALRFDGVNDLLVVHSPINFPILGNGERTVSAWFRTTQNDGIIVAIGSSHEYQPYNEQFAVAARTDGVMLYGGGGANDFLFSNSGVYLDGEWRHLLVTKKGNNAQLYINGRFIGSTTAHTYETGKSNAQNIMIGRWNDPNRYFKGDIDDVRIYNRALDQFEIDALYNLQIS